MSKFKNYLFASLLYSNECADDDTMFVSPEFKKWADEFESWIIRKQTDYSNRKKKLPKVEIFHYQVDNIKFHNAVEVGKYFNISRDAARGRCYSDKRQWSNWKVIYEEHEIDFSHQIYEYILLQKPMKCVHEISKCNSDIIERINKKEEDNDESSDPRWAALKNIKFE